MADNYIYVVDTGKAEDIEATDTLYFATPKAAYDWIIDQQHDKYTLKEQVGKKKLVNITLDEQEFEKRLAEDSVCLTVAKVYEVEKWFNVNKQPLNV